MFFSRVQSSQVTRFHYGLTILELQTLCLVILQSLTDLSYKFNIALLSTKRWGSPYDDSPDRRPFWELVGTSRY